MSDGGYGAPREDAYSRLVWAVSDLGFPVGFADQLAEQLRSNNAMLRMAAYLSQGRPQSVEQIVDEMFAIIQNRDRWIEQKRSEHANAEITRFYNRPRDEHR